MSHIRSREQYFGMPIITDRDHTKMSNTEISGSDRMEHFDVIVGDHTNMHLSFRESVARVSVFSFSDGSLKHQ